MKMTIDAMYEQYRRNIRALHFFDANCWIGKQNKFLPVLVYRNKELLELMDYYGIEKAIVSHTLARYYHPMAGNEILLNEISLSKRLLGCFTLLPPATDELGDIERYIENMINKGVYTARIFPESHNFSTSEWSLGVLLNKLEERRVPLFIWSREIKWDMIYSISHNHPQLPLILEFCDTEVFWNTRFVFALLEKCQNLYIEVHKTHLYQEIDQIVTRYGANRVIFSTYAPIDDPNASLMLITNGEMTRTEKEMIAHGNIENLLSCVIK